jgi:hypothetical protein
LKHYIWDGFAPSLNNLPPVPPKLLNIIKRPERHSAVTGGGQYTQEQIARALSKLDPTDFREHDGWLRLMMAVHHASNGDARHEFIEWSVTDPHYSDDAEVIGRRWDSLHQNKMDGITYRTLNKILREHDAADAQAAPKDAGDDFDDEDDSWLEGDEDNSWLEDGILKENPHALTDEALDRLAGLNEIYCGVMDGSKFKIARQMANPLTQRDDWVFMSPQDFMLKYCNERIERDMEGHDKRAAPTLPLGKAWVEWPKRRTYESILFDPSGKEHPGHLNMWKGFAVEPSPDGEWTYLEELVRDVLANGHDDQAEYILNWAAYMIQHPEQRAQAALVFIGGQGVGKGTFGHTLRRLIGRHALYIASSALLTGRFNGHLEDVIFLFADEATTPTDHEAVSRLKALVTEETLSLEAKGRDMIQRPNLLHIMIATNHEWVIKAEAKERRYFVSEVSSKWQGNRERFGKLLTQLDNGGIDRFLFDLKNRDISNFHPAMFPETEALRKQMESSFDPFERFLSNALYIGKWPSPIQPTRGPWTEKPIRLFVEDVISAFHLFCRDNGINPGSMGRGDIRKVMGWMRKLIPAAKFDIRESVEERPDIEGAPSDGRARAIELPMLVKCRADFSANFGSKFEWPEDEMDFG